MVIATLSDSIPTINERSLNYADDDLPNTAQRTACWGSSPQQERNSIRSPECCLQTGSGTLGPHHLLAAWRSLYPPQAHAALRNLYTSKLWLKGIIIWGPKNYLLHQWVHWRRKLRGRGRAGAGGSRAVYQGHLLKRWLLPHDHISSVTQSESFKFSICSHLAATDLRHGFQYSQSSRTFSNV